jgi:anti-anti-sigma regulatory factor
MLKIQRAANGETVFSLSGRMDAENIGEVKTMLSAEASGSPIVLDLKDLTLVDQDVVSFLSRCESAGIIQFANCPTYIREWINVERHNRGRSLFPDAQ